MEKRYWLGPGVLSHKGVDTAPGQVIPDDLDPGTVAALTGKGKIGDAPVTPAPPVSAEEKLRLQVYSLRAELAQAAVEIEALTAERDKLEQTVAMLTPAPPATGGKRK